MSSKVRHIGVVPIGGIASIIPRIVAAHVVGYFRVEARVTPRLRLPENAYDRQRLQYDAAVVLKEFNHARFQKYEKVIGVTDRDLFIPLFTHVFGEAQQGGTHALVSAYRLMNRPGASTVPTPQVLERTAKVALHELGHLYNLHHCMDANCLMHFSGGKQDLDRTPMYFCRYCWLSLRDILPSRPGL
jgi:archaemetzincin